MKKLLSILCAVACVLSFTFLGSSTVMAAETATYAGYESSVYEDYLKNIYSMLTMLTDEDIEAYLSAGDAVTVETMESWKAVKGQLGEYVGEGSFTVEEGDSIVTATLVTDYSTNDLAVTVVFNAEDLSVVSILASIAGAEETSADLGSVMAKAGLNTLMGMGTVFVILILISLIISSFGLIGKAQENKKAVAQPVVVETAPQVEVVEDETDDLELVAVISAAIAASEGTSTDGFVVRTIRKRR